MKKKILISGAGVSGLATALLLDDSKYDITVIEKADRFNTIGYAITLWRSGHNVVKEILADIESLEAEPIDSISYYGGDRLELIHKTEIPGDGYSVSREHLVKSLADELKMNHKNVKVKFNNSITEIEKTNSIAKVRLADGTSNEFDLVVLAEGMHSAARNKLFKTTISTMKYQLSYTWIDNCPNMSNKLINGIMKGGAFIIQSVQGRTLLALYNKADSTQTSTFEQRVIRLIEDVSGDHGRLDGSTQRSFGIETVEVERAFSGNVVLVGDTYHGHPPTLAFGTSAALEDTLTLARLLNELPDKDFDTNLHVKLKNYDDVRRKRIRQIYGFQDFVDKIVLSDSAAHIEILRRMLKMGGVHAIEYWLRHLARTGISY